MSSYNSSTNKSSMLWSLDQSRLANPTVIRYVEVSDVAVRGCGGCL